MADHRRHGRGTALGALGRSSAAGAYRPELRMTVRILASTGLYTLARSAHLPAL